MFCHKCGGQLEADDKFCGHCGANKSEIKSSTNVKKNSHASISGHATKNLYSDVERKKNVIQGFNPRFLDFLEKHKDISLIGVAWACWWRLVTLVWGSIFILSIFIAGLGELFD
jgi:hypothetical protein